MGFSSTVCPPLSAGADVIFPIDGEKPIGAAFSAGVGIGIDVHTVVPITETHFSFNLFDFIGEKFDSFKSWIKGEK